MRDLTVIINDIKNTIDKLAEHPDDIHLVVGYVGYITGSLNLYLSIVFADKLSSK